MSKFRNLTELDLASTLHPFATEIRRQQIINEPNPLKRLGAYLINASVQSFPLVMARLAGVRFTPQKLLIEGNGLHMVVLRDGDDVIKIDMASMHQTAEERQANLEKRQADHELMRSYLGDVVISETATIKPHPLLPDKDVIQVRQKYTPFTDPYLFEQSTATPIPETFFAFKSLHPEAWKGLGNFLEQSESLYHDTGVLPDTSRWGNLVIGKDASLHMIDGQPIRAGDPTQGIILQQFNLLRDHLDLAA